MLKIGDKITPKKALKLCRNFNLNHLIPRIESNPDKYKDWIFDGCSGLPDEVMGFFTGCDWQDITYKCCLPHDLCYAYGDPGNTLERKQADDTFYHNLITQANMKEWCAKAFLSAVRIGGTEQFGLSFSWAFAQNPKPKT